MFWRVVDDICKPAYFTDEEAEPRKINVPKFTTHHPLGLTYHPTFCYPVNGAEATLEPVSCSVHHTANCSHKNNVEIVLGDYFGIVNN